MIAEQHFFCGGWLRTSYKLSFRVSGEAEKHSCSCGKSFVGEKNWKYKTEE